MGNVRSKFHRITYRVYNFIAHYIWSSFSQTLPLSLQVHLHLHIKGIGHGRGRGWKLCPTQCQSMGETSSSVSMDRAPSSMVSSHPLLYRGRSWMTLCNQHQFRLERRIRQKNYCHTTTKLFAQWMLFKWKEDWTGKQHIAPPGTESLGKNDGIQTL